MKNSETQQIPRRAYVPPKIVEHGSVVEQTLGLPQGDYLEALSSGYAVANKT